MSEILKTVWDKFYGWAIPSALALGAFWLSLYDAKIFGDWLEKRSPEEKVALLAGLTFTLAICLSALSTPLYRVLEGYLWPHCLQKWGRRRHLARKRELKKDLEKDSGGTEYHRGLAAERLSRYPLDDGQVVPTKFGNAIRAFETYGRTRFGLDSQTLWQELCAVAPKYIEAEMNSARAHVDFFVAAFYLAVSFGVVCLAVFAVQEWKPEFLIPAAAAFLIALFSQWMAVRAVDAWSCTVQALVNIGRLKLADELGLELPKTLAEEKTMWGHAVSFVYFGEEEDGNALDRFRKPPRPADPLSRPVDVAPQ